MDDILCSDCGRPVSAECIQLAQTLAAEEASRLALIAEKYVSRSAWDELQENHRRVMTQYREVWKLLMEALAENNRLRAESK